MSCLSFGRAAFRLSIKDFEEKSKEESVIKGNICYYVSDKSLRKESKVVQTKKQYGDFSLTALSFASISIFSG